MSSRSSRNSARAMASNQPAYGNPYYAQPASIASRYGQPYVIQQPGYVYRDPYGEPYVPRRRGNPFPFE